MRDEILLSRTCSNCAPGQWRGQREHSNTRNLIFDCFSIIEEATTVCTLEPGLIDSDWNSFGVVSAMKLLLAQAGDVVRIENRAHRAYQNRVIEEPASTTVI